MQPIENFVNLVSRNWGYAIPSDNLWIIQIKNHNRGTAKEGKASFETLYSNITSVNASYKKSFASAKWAMNLNSNSANEFFSGFNTSIGLFLASDVTHAVNSNSINSAANANFTSHGGFLSQGKVLLARNNDLQAKITFMSTNWDISEIVIDPWIAAISQQGLIESSDLPNIKADISIFQYATSHPGKLLQGDEIVLRKETTLYEAFPISRDDVKLTYDNAEAGTLKTHTTTFAFRDYEIKYHAGFGASQHKIL